MGISVVIPCFNEEQYIESCLNSILENGFPLEALEILVVDGGSNDDTLTILRKISQKYPIIKILDNKHKVTPYALNMGIEHASNAYIMVAGAHAIYPNNYLNSLYETIQNPEIDIIGGAIETVTKHSNKKSNSIKYVLSHPLGVGNAMFRIGAKELVPVDTVPFGLYPKNLFSKVGNYNVKLIRNHDMELSKRIIANGYKIWMDPSKKVKYFARETYSGLFENNYANGFWNIKTVWITKNFKSLSFRHFVPLIFVLSLFLPLIGMIFYKYLVLISLLSIALYLFSVVAIALRGTENTAVVSIIKSFFVLHFSYGMGSLMAIFSLVNFRK
ncbi:MAG: glycosyltransferase family 2 protein [Salinivirgaceae bacterium]|nr:glycosyltransferase family 2 protein [Salinivirgaceae bacterium]